MTAKRSLTTRLKIGANSVAGLTSIPPVSPTTDMLDATTLEDTHRRYVPGVGDGGQITVAGFLEAGDTNGQLALYNARRNGTLLDFEVVFPASVGASWSFDAYVQNVAMGGAEIDGLLSFEATLQIDGEPVLNTEVSGGLTALSLAGTGGTLSPAFANDVYYYTFDGVSASSVTVTATAADHTLKLYIDGTYSADLTSGSASSAISLTLDEGKKLTIIAQEDGKTSVVYEVIVVKTA